MEQCPAEVIQQVARHLDGQSLLSWRITSHSLKAALHFVFTQRFFSDRWTNLDQSSLRKLLKFTRECSFSTCVKRLHLSAWLPVVAGITADDDAWIYNTGSPPNPTIRKAMSSSSAHRRLMRKLPNFATLLQEAAATIETALMRLTNCSSIEISPQHDFKDLPRDLLAACTVGGLDKGSASCLYLMTSQGVVCKLVDLILNIDWPGPRQLNALNIDYVNPRTMEGLSTLCLATLRVDRRPLLIPRLRLCLHVPNEHQDDSLHYWTKFCQSVQVGEQLEINLNPPVWRPQVVATMLDSVIKCTLVRLSLHGLILSKTFGSDFKHIGMLKELVLSFVCVNGGGEGWSHFLASISVGIMNLRRLELCLCVTDDGTQDVSWIANGETWDVYVFETSDESLESQLRWLQICTQPLA